MNRHRRFLITLGTLQLLVAVCFFMIEAGMLAKYAGRESIYAAMEIVEVLEDRGDLLVPEDSQAANGQEAAISVIVHEKIERRESTIEIYVWALAILGLLTLVAGVWPDRKKHTPQAHT
ncbi:MAG: hypothetical protein AAFV77_03725 [Planctomycetota bacterium]